MHGICILNSELKGYLKTQWNNNKNNTNKTLGGYWSLPGYLEHNLLNLKLAIKGKFSIFPASFTLTVF